MEELSIILMEKDINTKLFIKEIGSFTINSDIEFINKFYAINENDNINVYLYLTAPGEYNDEEYNYILDNYDYNKFDENIISIEEDEENYNPGWIFKFNYIDNIALMEELLNNITALHISEIERLISEKSN